LLRFRFSSFLLFFFSSSIDYANFSSFGAGALIQEFRIICQGTPIEEILDYNTMFEMWMDIGGFCQEEFKMYMENPWRAPAIHPSTEVNFVKPPMVDREGVIMCPSEVNMFGVPSKFHNYRQQGRSLTVNEHGYPNIISSITGLNKGGKNGPDISANFSTIFPKAAVSDTYRNYLHTWDPTEVATNSKENWCGSAAPGNVRASTWTNAIDNTYVTWPATIRPVPKPLMQVQNKLNEQGIKKYRLQDYFMFLANVKNIPIGVAPKQSFLINNKALVGEMPAAVSTLISYDTEVANWNFTALTAMATNFSSTQTFTIALPIFSGLIGVWAEKAFPTMLIAPGSFYLQIRFAKVAQAFQFTMDPCRRIFGTYRDYVPSIGLLDGYITEHSGNVLNHGRRRYLENNTGLNTWLAITPHGANGTDFAFKGWRTQPETAGYGAQVITHQVTDNTNLVPVVYDVTDVSFTNTYNSAQTLAEKFLNAGVYTADSKVLMGLHENDGYVTGNPKPQYVPVEKPWLYGGRFTDVLKQGTTSNYCEESDNCFGTYLPASTPQVRRTTQSSNARIAQLDSANLGISNSPKVDITIQNLMYVGQQIILPDEVTSSIVKMAVNGDISLLSHSCKTYRTTLNSASSQNLILPIKIASANALFVLFQNTQMLENSHYASCTRNCPFTSFQWNSKDFDPLSNISKNDLPYFVGSDVPPVVKSVSTLTPFSIQLRLGNEMLPIQPITNVHMLTQELQRAVHAANDMMWSVPTISTFRNFRSVTGDKPPSAYSSSLTSNGNCEYLCLQNNDFLTPFIPVKALDDQTITDNILYRDYGLQANSRGQFVLNEFIPPISKFMLGFDLETFPNQSDMARSGRYLGNGPVTLIMTETVAPASKSLATMNQTDTYNAIAVVLFDIRFSIMSGGQVLSYY
jgi:hypothetical protein